MDSPKPNENPVATAETPAAPETPTAQPASPTPESINTTPATPAPMTPEPTTPPASTFVSPAPKSGGSKLPLLVVTVVLVLVGIAAVYLIMANSAKTSPTSKQATLDNGTITPPASQPTVIPSPTPDLSNTGLQQDQQAVDQSINDINTQINNVNSALNDQQTNLQ
ncbi:MAG: hypothetical protein ACM3IJ_05685 [Candidatus Levyibacteriota bacterium]